MSARAAKVDTDPPTVADPRPSATIATRHTRQQAAVDEVFSDQHDFRSAQETFDELRRRGQTVSLTTVYRTLQRMSSAGELDSIRTGDGEMAYRRCSTRHHHHLVCRVCGRTVEVAGLAVEKWTERVAEEHGYTDVRHDLEIFGVCASCAPGH